MRFTWLVAAAGMLALGFAERASGQGMFGQTNQGASAATRTPTASSAARTSTGTSTGGTSGGSTGGTAMNTQNVAQTAQQNMVTNAAQPTQVRGAFVGADSSDVTNARSLQGLTQGGAGTTQRGGTSGLNQLQNLFSQGMQQLNQQNQRSARPQIRTPLRLGFESRPVSMTNVRRLESHLTKLPGIRFVGSPELMLEGRTAVLRGTVASEDDRRLAEALAKMHPDVLAVRNELQVDASATRAAEELPANQP